MAKGVPGAQKIKIEKGHTKGICDFCLKKGESFRLRSNHRKYRFIVVCPECLNKIRDALEG